MRQRSLPNIDFEYFPRQHPSQYALRDMAEAAEGLGLHTTERAEDAVVRHLGRLAWHSRRLRRWGGESNTSGKILPLMGPQRNAAAFMSMSRRTVAPYAFDCWPPQYSLWDDLLALLRPRVCAFTASAAAQRYDKLLPDATVLWLPEAIHERRITPSPLLKDRSIGLLELGRRYDRFHEMALTSGIDRAGRHLYEDPPGRIIFPTSLELANGLKDSRLVACFPSSRTHPERAGNTATITQRYLEAMANRCVVVGEAPDELTEIFGYDPVVSVEWDRAGSQLMEMITSIGDYQTLVDRNLARLRETSLWSMRLRVLVDALAKKLG